MTAGPQDSSASAPETVLLVDGDVLLRVVIASYLRECGYRVIEAADAEEALRVLEQDELRIDAMLCDVALTGEVDGFSLARRARERRPGLDVIMTGTAARAAHEAAELCEHGPQLKKPYEPQAVVDLIRRLRAERDRSGPR
jgi:CheY-like chemotaxis protein